MCIYVSHTRYRVFRYQELFQHPRNPYSIERAWHKLSKTPPNIRIGSVDRSHHHFLSEDFAEPNRERLIYNWKWQCVWHVYTHETSQIQLSKKNKTIWSIGVGISRGSLQLSAKPISQNVLSCHRVVTNNISAAYHPPIIHILRRLEAIIHFLPPKNDLTSTFVLVFLLSSTFYQGRSLSSSYIYVLG